MKAGKGAPIILVIEDCSDSRAPMSSRLRANGYKVVEAKDGGEGLLQAHRVHPDLILIDLATAASDGVEATRQMRRRRLLSNTPIFAVNAQAAHEISGEALAAGCTEVFSKPLNLEALLGKIKNTLGA